MNFHEAIIALALVATGAVGLIRHELSERRTGARCVNCRRMFSGKTNGATVAKFLDPADHPCAANWYPLVDPPGPYSQVGRKR